MGGNPYHYDDDPTEGNATHGDSWGWDVSCAEGLSSIDSSGNVMGRREFNGDISKWDRARGEHGGPFSGAATFNQPLAWDTSKVTSMSGTFRGRMVFNSELAWDTSKVTNLASTPRHRRATSERARDTSW